MQMTVDNRDASEDRPYDRTGEVGGGREATLGRYWVVLAAVHLVEMVVDPLVDFFPGYLLAK